MKIRRRGWPIYKVFRQHDPNRYHRGWSDNEIIEGKRHTTEARAPESEATVLQFPREIPRGQQSVAADTYHTRLAKILPPFRVRLTGGRDFIATPAENARNPWMHSPLALRKDLTGARRTCANVWLVKTRGGGREYKPSFYSQTENRISKT